MNNAPTEEEFVSSPVENTEMVSSPIVEESEMVSSPVVEEQVIVPPPEDKILTEIKNDVLEEDSQKIQPFPEESVSTRKSKKNKKSTNTKKRPCPKGRRRNPKTKRCRKRCPSGKRRSKRTHQCVKTK